MRHLENRGGSIILTCLQHLQTGMYFSQLIPTGNADRQKSGRIWTKASTAEIQARSGNNPVLLPGWYKGQAVLSHQSQIEAN